MDYAIKLWMINENGESVFGNGLAELLEEIDKQKSVLKAAGELGDVVSLCFAQAYFGGGQIRSIIS